jgi:hypothetical protein
MFVPERGVAQGVKGGGRVLRPAQFGPMRRPNTERVEEVGLGSGPSPYLAPSRVHVDGRQPINQPNISPGEGGRVPIRATFAIVIGGEETWRSPEPRPRVPKKTGAHQNGHTPVGHGAGKHLVGYSLVGAAHVEELHLEAY